jgi:integrase
MAVTSSPGFLTGFGIAFSNSQKNVVRGRLLLAALRGWKRSPIYGVEKSTASSSSLENSRNGPTPHRFRHTFARILLQKGVPVADVADLLGDDEETVREHYARWVPERQARLTSILREAFVDKPKPKLVSLPGRRK